MFLFFSSVWLSSVLVPALIHSCTNKLQFVYLTITSHLACWKSQKFPISEGKKLISKNLPKYKSIVYTKLLIWKDVKWVPQTAYYYWALFLKSISQILWYMLLFLTEHNLSFTLFLIRSYFFAQSELRCSYKVCSYKKRVYWKMIEIIQYNYTFFRELLKMPVV